MRAWLTRPERTQLDHQLGPGLPAELVTAGVDDLLCPLELAEVLHSPGPRRHRLAHDDAVPDQSPVGADDAVEAQLVAQQPGDDALAEGEADLLPVGADRHPVVGHDLRGSGRDRGPERLQVVLHLPARVDLLAPVREVRVFTVLLRTTAGEMLGHGGHRGRAELGALEAADVGGNQTRGQVGVLAEGHPDARPPGFGGQVDLRVQRHPDTGGEVLLASDVGVPLHEVGVTQRREAQRLRPLRERARQSLGARVVAEGVPRIGRQGHRDAGPGRQRQLLHAVVPGHQVAHVVHLPREVEVVEPHLPDGCLGGGPAEGVVRAHQLPAWPHRDDVVKHQSGLVLDREPGEQVLDPVLHAVRRILVRLDHDVSCP